MTNALSRRAIGRLALVSVATLGVPIGLPPAALELERKRKYYFLRREIPEFEAPLVGGGQLTRDSFTGKWSILDFWGLWCGPCLNDAPFISVLSKKMSEHSGLAYISVHSRKAYGRWGSVENYFAEKGYSYPVGLDPDERVMKRFKLNATPTYLIIGPDRIVRAGHQGSFDAAGRETATQFLRLFIDLHDGKIKQGGDGSED
jgi:thiol-disulfide isomerase/thioredoxin